MQLTVGYCTSAEFTEYPTFLDLVDLRSGDQSLRHQTQTLTKLLLVASRWCDRQCELGTDGTLTAHTRVENKTLRPDRYGRLAFHPDHIPFISLESVAVGWSPTNLTTYTSPTVWPEDGRRVLLDLGGGTTAWSGNLQFGGPSPGAALLATMAYTAGFPNTQLTSDVTVGAVSLPVAGVTGVRPGDTLRIYDPGSDENITVGSSWVQTTGAGTLPLATGLEYAHATVDAQTQEPSPVRVSAMTGDILEACVLYTISLLIRPDTSAEDAFPDLPGGVSTRLADSRKTGSGLVEEARCLLRPYARVI